jgi:hypothetical protein
MAADGPMRMMNQELPALIADANAIAAEAERTFGQLTREQLNWKPGADQWSVAQCFEHLITINRAYTPQLRLIEQGAYAPTWRDHVPVLARLFGSMILRAVQPESSENSRPRHTSHRRPARSMATSSPDSPLTSRK